MPLSNSSRSPQGRGRGRGHGQGVPSRPIERGGGSQPSSPQSDFDPQNSLSRSETNLSSPSPTQNPHISLTPPTEHRHLPFASNSHSAFSLPLSGSSQNLGSGSGLLGSLSHRGRQKHKIKVSPPSSRETSAGSRGSDESSHSWHKFFSPRSWKATPSKKHPVPKEQTDAYLRTKSRVHYAIKSVSEVGRIGLDIVGEAGEMLPVPGLGPVAKLLSSIWDALDEVGSNRLACLRLAGRCADFLLAIEEEIHEQGPQVMHELERPINRLESAFAQIYELMVELKNRPFWKRLLDRDEIQVEIEKCYESLHDCLYLFNMSILTRILKNTSTPANQPIEAITHGMLWEDSTPASTGDFPDVLEPVGDEFMSRLPLFASSPPATDDLALADAERIRDRLRALQDYQNELDKAADMTDLRELLSAALNATNDRDMQKVLQVAGKDMPKAIRTLLLVLEGRGPHWRPPPSSAMNSTKALPRTRALTWPLDEKESSVLDGEHIETGIAAVQRLVQGYETDLPSWTVNRNDLSFQELVGRGFFSNVYKGTWRHRTVAVKVLEKSTLRDVFLDEISVWRSLNHPNVLRLYGASDPDQGRPFFLISPYMRNGSLSEYLKRVEWDGSMLMGASMVSEVYGDIAEPDLLRFMVEIARGMEYMHATQVVHGDLKGANVLLDNEMRCVLADFGHSKPLSQISFTNPKHAHGLRWQSPELMTERSLLTKENDVYAFAITCVEIVTMGSLPWPMMPDDVVKKLVLEQNSRPPYPSKIVDQLGVRHILERSWDSGYLARPTFSQLVRWLESAMSGLSFSHSREASLPSEPSGNLFLPLPRVSSDPEEMIPGSYPLSPPAEDPSATLSRQNTVLPKIKMPQPVH